MALVVASPQHATPVNPTSSLQNALQEFKNILPFEQQKLFSQQHQTPAASDVLKFVAELDANNQNRAGRCVASRVCTFLNAIQQFTGVVDTFVSSNPSIAALVWGSVKTALIVAGNASSYFDKVTAMIMEVGRSCPVLAQFASLYSGSIGLQEALCDYYSAIVKLCVKVVDVNQRTGVKHVWSSLISSFEAEFKPDLEVLYSLVRVVKLRIDLASKQAASDMYTLAELEQKSNEAFRLSSLDFRKEARQEQKAAHLWRVRKARERVERLRTDIKDRLSSIDYLKPWKQAQKRRMPSTAEWFQREPAFEDWRNDSESSVLWCAGLMGAGKTVFASSMISYLHRVHHKHEIVCHYFCQTELESSLSASAIIGTLARQMIGSGLESLSETELSALYEQCINADVSDLTAILCKQLVGSNATYFVLVDGLDECSRDEIEVVASSMAELCAQSTACIKVMYIGRPELEERLFRGHSMAKYRLPITKAALSPDIKSYIAYRLDQCLEDGRLRLNDATLVIRVSETLENEADGMFLWVHLFIDELCARSTDDEILEALHEPPRQLSTLLDLKLGRIHTNRGADLAVKVLQLCGVAKRPLLANELRELLSMSVGQDSLDVTRLPHSMDEIVDRCGGLVFVDEEDFSVQYVHHSVGQYLFSNHCQYQAEFLKEVQDENLGFLALTYLNFRELGRQLARFEKDANLMIKPINIAASTVFNRGRKTGKMAQLLLRYQSSLRGLSKLELERKAQELAGENPADRLTSEVASRQFCFLDYAQKYWVYHFVHTDSVKNTRMRGFFEACVDGSNDFAQRPWLSTRSDQQEVQHQETDARDAVKWAIETGHCSLFRYCLKKDRGVLLELQRIDICHDVPLTSLRTFIEIFLECSTWYKQQVRHIVVELSRRRLWDIVTMVLDRTHDTVSMLSTEITGLDPIVSALGAAVAHGEVKVVEKLLRAGAQVNVTADKNYGRTVLQLAAGSGHYTIVDELLKAGARVNAATIEHYGRTALQAAAGGGHLAVVETLLRAGADVNAAAARYGGRTALQAAAGGGYLEVVERLLRAGADVNVAAVEHYGRTALQAAASGGYLAVVDRLLVAGAEVNTAPNTYSRRTALHAASEGGHVAIVNKLLSAGAEVNATATYRGRTALHTAAGGGHLAIVDRLLLAGAEVNAFTFTATDGRQTAFDIATKGGHLAVAERLKVAGGAASLKDEVV